MSVVLTPGIDLGGRTLYLSIPSGTTVSEERIVARCGSNNLIRETVSGGVTSGVIEYIDGNGATQTITFYSSSGTNMPSVNVPAGFGAITEINEDAVLYPYIQRTEHEKTYLITEDMGKEEYKPAETAGQVILLEAQEVSATAVAAGSGTIIRVSFAEQYESIPYIIVQPTDYSAGATNSVLGFDYGLSHISRSGCMINLINNNTTSKSVTFMVYVFKVL